MSFVTLTEIKDYLQINHSDDDAFFNALIPLMDAEIIASLGKPFDEVDYVEYYDGGNDFIALAHTPVTEIIITDEMYGDVLEDTEYRLLNTGVVERVPFSTWPTGSRRWKFEYTAGDATIPSDLKLAVLQEMARFYNERNTSLTQKTTEGMSQSLKQDMSDNVKRVLARHRDIGF